MTSKVSGFEQSTDPRSLSGLFCVRFVFFFFGPLTERFLRSLSRGSAPVCQFTDSECSVS